MNASIGVGREYSDSKVMDQLFAQFHFTCCLLLVCLRVNIQCGVEPAPKVWDLLTLREHDHPVPNRHKQCPEEILGALIWNNHSRDS